MSDKNQSTVGRILPWLMVVVAGASLRTGISSLSPILDRIQADLALSAAALGILTTIPVMCMGALSSIGSALEERIGMKHAMVVALGTLTIAFLLRLEAKSYAILLMTAGLVGIADAIIRPILAGFIKHHFPTHASAAMGTYTASMGVGSAVAVYGTQKINAWTHSWPAALAVWAIPTAIGLVIWLLWNAREEHDARATDSSKVYPITRLEITGFTLFFGLQAGLNYVLLAWFTTLYKEAGYTDHTSAVWLTVFILLMTLSGLLSHWLIRILKLSDTGALWLYSVLAVVGALSLPYISVLPWCAPILLGLTSGSIFHLALMMPLHFSHSRREATRLSGIIQSRGYLIIGGPLPWIAGVVSDRAGSHSRIAWFVVVISFLLLGTTLWIGTIYRKYHNPPSQNDSYENLSEAP